VRGLSVAESLWLTVHAQNLLAHRNRADGGLAMGRVGKGRAELRTEISARLSAAWRNVEHPAVRR
jgi:hypothetical protein